VAVEKRVYLSQEDEQLLIGIPDVAVTGVSPPPELPAQPTTQAITAVIEPLTVELPDLQEVQERYLEISPNR
jgi:Protein of unknown function (DUF4058)